MKNLLLPLFISHLAVALPAVCATMIPSWSNSHIVFGFAVGAILALALAFSVAYWWSHRFALAQKTIENAIASGQRPLGCSSYEVWASQLQVHIQHWIDSAANSRQDLREIEAVLGAVDPRMVSQDGGRRVTSQRLKDLLAEMGIDSANVLQQMVANHREIEDFLQTAAKSFEQQSTLLIVTERELERVRQSTESNNLELTNAQASISSTLLKAADINEQAIQFQRGIENLRGDVSVVEGKMRLLREHTAEIAALARSIAEVSARTDLLALNASIESVRACDDGRGFSDIADEIRSLASQIAETSRSILDRVEFLDSETDETNEIILRSRKGLSTECDRAIVAKQRLQEHLVVMEHIVGDVDGVRAKSTDQLEHASAVVKSLQKVGDTSECHRTLIDEIRWKYQLVSKCISRLTDAIEPLLRSVTHGGKGNTSEMVQDSADGRCADQYVMVADDLETVGQVVGATC